MWQGITTGKNPTLSTMLNQQKGETMSQKYIYDETWNTRYGKSTRKVVREQGRFVSNKSKRQLKAGEDLGYSVSR